MLRKGTWLVVLYINSVYILNAILFQYNVGFFPRRTIKNHGKGVSAGYLSIFSQFDFMSSSNVNVCQPIALFWTGFLSKLHGSDCVMLILPSISVHPDIQYNWSIKVLCANYNNQERPVYVFLKKIVQYSGILRSHTKPLCGNGSVIYKPLCGKNHKSKFLNPIKADIS